MTFLTGYMEVMLAVATDPQEIKLRRQVLDDHLAHQKASPGDPGDIPIAAAVVDEGDNQDSGGA